MLPLKEVLKSVQNTSCVLDHTLATSWSSWTKVHAIGAQPTEAAPGLSQGNVPYARLSLFMENSEHVFLCHLTV